MIDCSRVGNSKEQYTLIRSGFHCLNQRYRDIIFTQKYTLVSERLDIYLDLVYLNPMAVFKEVNDRKCKNRLKLF